MSAHGSYFYPYIKDNFSRWHTVAVNWTGKKILCDINTKIDLPLIQPEILNKYSTLGVCYIIIGCEEDIKSIM